MPKSVLTRVHLTAAVGAITVITAFLAVSAVTELAGSPGEIRAVRQGIMLALPLLIACLATAGLTGRRLAGRSRSAVVRAKKLRLAAAAVVGLAVLVPCALFLAHLTAAHVAGPATTALEATELAFGSLNLSLLALNLRDGLRMRRRHKNPSRPRQLAGSKP
jgi:hypothetical protein